MTAPREPLSTLKALERWIENPLRIDAKRNTATYDLKKQRSVASRLRHEIARLQNHGDVK